MLSCRAKVALDHKGNGFWTDTYRRRIERCTPCRRLVQQAAAGWVAPSSSDKLRAPNGALPMGMAIPAALRHRRCIIWHGQFEVMDASAARAGVRTWRAGSGRVAARWVAAQRRGRRGTCTSHVLPQPCCMGAVGAEVAGRHHHGAA